MVSSKLRGRRGAPVKPHVCHPPPTPPVPPPSNKPWDHCQLYSSAYWPEGIWDHYGCATDNCYWDDTLGLYIATGSNQYGDYDFRVTANEHAMTCSITVTFTDPTPSTATATENDIPVEHWQGDIYDDYLDDVMNPEGQYLGDLDGYV